MNFTESDLKDNTLDRGNEQVLHMHVRKSDVCIYCQVRKPDTVDHVPPKSLFTPPKPPLIKVPCCNQCNQEFSKDDPQLRQYLTSRPETENHPSTKSLTVKALRALDSDNRMQRELDQNTRLIERIRIDGTPDLVVQFRPDDDSLERLIGRIIRGLMFHHTGELLPTDCEFTIGHDHGLNEAHKQEHEQRIKDLLKDEPVHFVGDVFEYQYGVTENRTTSIWYMRFLQSVWLFGTSNIKDPRKTK